MAEALSWIEALLLGVVQGLTEWLPISSSGHLVLAQQTLGIEATLFFDLLLHVGTLAVVLVFYRERVGRILVGLATAPGRHLGGASFREVWIQDPDRRLASLVIVGSVPTAIIGFTFEDFFVGLFTSLTAVGIALVATGLFLFSTRWATEDRGVALGVLVALVIGTAQGLAIIPGASRSGATIGAALLLGVDRELAVEYSFLLSVPAILGATIFQADAASIAEASANLPIYALGVVASVLVGYAALALLVLLVRRRVFHRFAPYCWAVGGLALYLGLT